MNDVWKHSGATLLHVLLLVLVLSSILVTEFRFRAQQSRSLALDYTVAQTEMLLNEAYYYFRQNSRWPDCGSWLQQTRNGWGVNVHCEYANPVSGYTANRNNAGGFLVRQYVPSHLGEIFEGRYRSTDVAGALAYSAHSVPAGYAAYTVKTNRAGGASQTIDIVQLASSGPVSVPKLECESGTNLGTFTALGAMVSRPNLPASVRTLISFCFDSVLVPARTVRFGFRMLAPSPGSTTLPVGYDMYRQRYGGTHLLVSYFDGSNLGITGDSLRGEWGCQYPPSSSYYDDGDDDDGNGNADYQVNGVDITAFMFQFCR